MISMPLWMIAAIVIGILIATRTVSGWVVAAVFAAALYLAPMIADALDAVPAPGSNTTIRVGDNR